MTFNDVYERAGWLDDPHFVYLGCGSHWFWPLAKAYGTVDYWAVNTRGDSEWSWTVQLEDEVGQYASMPLVGLAGGVGNPHPPWYWNLYFYDMAKLNAYHFLATGQRPLLAARPDRVLRNQRDINKALQELRKHCHAEVDRAF